MTRRAVAAAALLVTITALPALARPPVTPRDVPCPSVDTGVGTASLLAQTAAGVAIPSALPASYGATSFAGIPRLGVHAYTVPSRRLIAFSAALRAVPGVHAVQLDAVVRPARSANDPLLNRQWPLSRMHVQRAWDIDIGVSNPVSVAVLDTGVDGAHPDLVGRVVDGIDTVDGDGDASDEQFHGTAVASVIAANANNGVGMAGISWGAQIVPVRVLGSDGEGSECTIAAGIVWAADHARILNMSLGAATPCTDVVRTAVDYAVRRGALLVAAVGNSAKKGNPPEEPADCPGVVGVGAVDQHNRVASFSEHGPQVSVSAPGVRVLAAYRAPHAETWGYLDGTSMAAPMVSGVGALLLSRHPGWTSAQVQQRILATAVDRGRHGRDDYFGAGVVDAARALGH